LLEVIGKGNGSDEMHIAPSLARR